MQHARGAQQEASRRGVAGWGSDRVRSAPRRAPRLAMPRRRLLHYLGKLAITVKTVTRALRRTEKRVKTVRTVNTVLKNV